MNFKKYSVVVLLLAAIAAGYGASRLSLWDKAREVFFPVKSYKAGLRKVLDINKNLGTPAAEVLSFEVLPGEVELTKLYFSPFGKDIKIESYLFKPVAAHPEKNKKYPTVIVYQGHVSTLYKTALEKKHYEKALPLYLAENGYVTFVFSIDSLEKELGYQNHGRASREKMLEGKTVISEYLKTGLQAVKYLRSLGYVDGENIGVAGTSRGGKLAVYTAALDKNIKSVVSAGYMLSYNLLGIESCSCNFIPGILPDYDFPVTASIIAPRPALYIIGEKDTLSCAIEGDTIVENILSISYEKVGARDNLGLHLHGGGHKMVPESALEWFDRTLKNNE